MFDNRGLQYQPPIQVEDEVMEEQESILDKYGRELVSLAENNEIGDIIGRDNEIRDMIEILLRNTKNNPIILGEAGVGKTALVEGLAHLIARNEVPDLLKNKKIFELDLASMLAGAKYKGEFEERFKEIMSEIKASNGEIILFVDEIHTFLNAGKSEGSLDAGNMLKPMLARGEITCIGATTLSEYKQSFGKDLAIARRFQQVVLKETSIRETIAILRKSKEKLQNHYNLSIADEALVSAVEMADRYVKDRFMPDKAIDLIDETCSLVRTENETESRETYLKRRAVNRLELEMSTLANDMTDSVQEELSTMEEKYNQLTTELQSINHRQHELEDLQTQLNRSTDELNSVKRNLRQAESNGNLTLKVNLEQNRIPTILQQIDTIKEQINALNGTDSTLFDVTKDEIARIVSRKTGVPVTKMLSSDREKLLHLDEALAERVIGQDDAVRLVTETVWRSRAGIQDENRPIGSFLFAGQTGVGKTELAKALTEQLFDSERNLIRVDMSEYMEKHSVARLVGSPPGYVGFESGGQLTEQVRKNPYSVILFDEIEKAHPDVSNLLLQILDDGCATDAQGHKVDFTNTIIILTTNLGAKFLSPDAVNSNYEGTKELVMSALTSHFRPEMINRIDEIVMFMPLGNEQFVGIANKFLTGLKKRLEKKRINLTFGEDVLNWIVENGSDAEMGARPIRRYVQSHIENKLAKELIAHEVLPDSTIELNIVDNDLAISI